MVGRRLEADVDGAQVLARLWEVYEVQNDSALSRAMGEKRSTVGGWRARKAVPYEVCIRVSKEKKLSLAWLLEGTEPRQASAEQVEAENLLARSELLGDREAAAQLYRVQERQVQAFSDRNRAAHALVDTVVKAAAFEPQEDQREALRTAAFSGVREDVLLMLVETMKRHGNTPSFDAGIMESVIKMLLEAVQARGRKPDPAAFAKTCLAIYEFARPSGTAPAAAAVNRLVETLP